MGNNQNGTEQQPPSKSESTLRNKKLRGAASERSLKAQTSRTCGGEPSLRSLGELHIRVKNSDSNDPQQGRVTCKKGNRHPPYANPTPTSIENVTVRLGRREEVVRPTILWSTGSQAASAVIHKTPAQEHGAEAALEQFETVLLTAVKTPASPTKSYSPAKPQFLTKESTLTGFTAWDVDERLHTVESQFSVLKEVMNSSLTNKKALEEAMDLAKTRGKGASARLRATC